MCIWIIVAVIIICVVINNKGEGNVSKKEKEIIDKYVSFASDNSDVKMKFNNRYGSIECEGVDKYGRFQRLRDESLNWNVNGGSVNVNIVARHIYNRLADDRYEYLCADANNIIIQESLEYRLKNSIKTSVQNSTATSLQDRLRECAAQENSEARAKYINDEAQKAYQGILSQMENMARNTTYVAGRQVEVKTSYREPSLFHVKLHSLEQGEGIFVSKLEYRAKWTVTPTAILCEIINQLESLCKNDHIKTNSQMEIRVINTCSRREEPKVLQVPMRAVDVNGEWGEDKIEIALIVTASTNY